MLKIIAIVATAAYIGFLALAPAIASVTVALSNLPK